ncbi:MAG: endonuclease MutS2 [Anaerolineaceae bacterium]|nr:endonuclease MutS2 [Anaerolineaceae bacterium]
MDQKTLNTLEFNKIQSKLAEYAAFSASKELAFNLRPENKLDLVQTSLAATSEARYLLSLQAEVSVGGSRDIRPWVNRAAQHGVLEASELLTIKTTLIAGRDLHRVLESNADKTPHLAELGQDMVPPPGIIEAISKIITDRGEVADNATPKLASIRKETKIAHDRLLGKLQQMISDPNKIKLLQEAIITQRNGRYVIPLRAEFKGRIKAIIHDQSSSGATLFIEPLSTVELNNRWHELQLEERDEIRRILSELSDQIGAEVYTIRNLVYALAKFDLILMKAKYAEDLDAVEPIMVNFQEKAEGHPGSTIRLRDARHPLLDPNTVVAIDVELDDETFGVIITGPNTGGKTVSLKTVGLLALMAQSGLHIPAQSGSQLSVFSDIFADIGDEQSIEQSLSTFSGHITNITRILKQATSTCLVLFDELGSGTDPQEGSALAQALLTFLVSHQITSIIATHYPELKAYAHSTPGVINASMEFNLRTLKPTYHLLIGLPGRSNALAICERLGLQKEIIEDARSRVDPNELHAEDLLNEIHRQNKIARRERRSAEKARKRARDKEKELDQKLEKIEDQRLEILEKARQEAEDTVETLQEEIRLLRRDLARARQPLEALKAMEEKADAIQAEVQTPVIRKEASSSPRSFKLGDKVKVRSVGMKGVITAITESDVEVQVGNLRIRAELKDIQLPGAQDESESAAVQQQPKLNSRVRKVLEQSAKQENPAIISVNHPSPGSELDLRGQMAEDALAGLENFVENAYLAAMPFVRIIHGKGTGKLRQVVRQALTQSQYINRWESGTEREGGDGVTVAFLNND